MGLSCLLLILLVIPQTKARDYTPVVNCLRCDGEDCNTDITCAAEKCYLRTIVGENNGVEYRRGCWNGRHDDMDPTFNYDFEGPCKILPGNVKLCLCSNGDLCNQGTMEEYDFWQKHECRISNDVVYYSKMMMGGMMHSRNFTKQVIDRAVSNAFRYMKHFYKEQKMFRTYGIDTSKSDHRQSVANRLHHLFTNASPRSLLMSSDGLLYEEIAKLVAMRSGLNEDECIQLQLFKIRPVKLNACPFHDQSKSSTECESLRDDKFRTLDGECNNLDFKSWGASFTPFPRFIAPAYGNLLDAPKTKSWFMHEELPSARVVSTTIIKNQGDDDVCEKKTYLLMQWGQFIDHDMSHTPISKGDAGASINCCPENLAADQKKMAGELTKRPECFPIHIPKDDPYFGPLNKTCLNFARSVPTPNLDCTLGYREQLNEITSFLDASMVYGETKEKSNRLRAHVDGLLATANDGEDPPMDLENKQGCLKDAHFPEARCVFAGDLRSNEQPALRSMHTVFVRIHNKLALQLRDMNPGWDDERIFQEARKIVGALIQRVTYGEFLKALFGPNMKDFNLELKENGEYFTEYDRTINPSIRNEFATAAYRMGHSLLRKHFSRMGQNYTENLSKMSLENSFFQPGALGEKHSVDGYIAGLLCEPTGCVDNKMTDKVTNELFKDPLTGDSLDLAALNIQRGRDHGLPGYNDFRKLCRGKYGIEKLPLKHATTFDDLNTTMDLDVIESLKKVYKDVRDVDAFVGMISERPLSGSMIGPTLTCIMGRQFKMLRVGDRFWHENNKAYVRFTKDKLIALRELKLADMLCWVVRLDSIQRDAFLSHDDVSNPRVKCSDMKKLNLEPWRDDGNEEDLSEDDNMHLLTSGYRDSNKPDFLP